MAKAAQSENNALFIPEWLRRCLSLLAPYSFRSFLALWPCLVQYGEYRTSPTTDRSFDFQCNAWPERRWEWMKQSKLLYVIYQWCGIRASHPNNLAIPLLHARICSKG